MSRGVPLIDPIRTERMVDYYIQSKVEEFHRTMLLVAASMGAETHVVNGYIDRYRKAVFGGEEATEELIERYADVLHEESKKEFGVKREWLPGETW